MDNLKSTKFIFAVMASIMGFVLIILKSVEADSFLKFIEVIGGSYIIGNVASKFADKESAN